MIHKFVLRVFIGEAYHQAAVRGSKLIRCKLSLADSGILQPLERLSSKT